MSALQRRSMIARLDDTGVPLLLARLAVGGMFAYLAFMKLQDPIEFLKLTREYGVLPTDPPILLNLTAVVMPWLEMVCAVALFLGLFRRGAALLLTGMMLFFTPLVIWHAIGLYNAAPPGQYASFCEVCFDCGCGTGVVCICYKAAENTALLLGSLVALFSRSHRFTLDAALTRWFQSSPTPVPAPSR